MNSNVAIPAEGALFQIDPQGSEDRSSALSLKLRRMWLLSLLLLIFAFGYVDRVMVQTLGQSIKADLRLSDLQLGALVGLGFAMLYSVVGLPVARLAERVDRINIISISVAIFSVMSLLCGTAGSFAQLLLYRVGVGFGEAGVQSPAASLVSDYYSPERRGGPLAIIKLGAPVGSVIGAFAGGLIAHAYGWRVALMSTAVPGLLLALALRLTLKDVRTHPAGEDGMADAPPPFRQVLVLMGREPAFRHGLAGLALATMGLYAAGAFVTPFFMRVHQLTIAQASAYFAILSGVSATIGMLISGFAIDLIGKKGLFWSGVLSSVGLVAAVPSYFIGYTVASAPLALTFQTVAGVFLILHSVPTLALFQNMVQPRMRSTAAFFYFFISTLVGIGLGPPLIGFLSDQFAQHAYPGHFAGDCLGAMRHGVTAQPVSPLCQAASASGLRSALIASLAVLLWGAVHYAFVARALRKTSTFNAEIVPHAVS